VQLQAAEFPLDHKWQPARALDVVRKAERLVAREREQEADDNLATVAIPQNWLLDPRGVWRWNQLGYDSSEAQWADRMLEKLESLKGLH